MVAENVTEDDPSATRSYDETRRYDPTHFESIAARVDSMARVEIDVLDPVDGEGPEEFQDEHSLHGMGGNGGGGKGRLTHRVFGTAEHKTYLKEGTRKRGRNAMFAFPAVLALTLLIGSIVYLELDDGSDDAPRGDGRGADVVVVVQGGVQSPPATGGQAVLATPWKGLAELCSEDSIESLGNYERCKEECEPAACCHLPMGDVLSCLANNVESCAEYEEACQYLSHHSAQTADADTKVVATVEIPAPPGDMTELCKSTALSTVDGYNDCAEACQAAECCTSKDCKPSNPELCGAYDPCSILTGTVSSHPHSIKSTIKKECSTSALFDGEGVEECRYACRPAECCFVDATDPQAPIRACLTDETEGWCSQYAPCHILPSLDDDGFDSHEEATSAIDDACQGDDKDMIKCVNLCSASVCCFEETQECWEEEGKVDFHCDHYAACAVVFSPFIGGVGDSAKTEEATAHVHTVALDESDVDEAADEAALAYDEAAIAAAVKIEAACLPDASGSLANDDVCRALCERRSCCFRVTEECDKQMLAMDFHCELFAPCQAVMTNSDGENPSPIIVDRNDDRMDGTGGGGNVQVARPIAHDYHEDDVAAALAIEAACSDESDQDECVRLCEDKSCCFQDTEECIEEMADVNLHCELFDVCGSVLGSPWHFLDKDGAGTGGDESETALGGNNPPKEEIAAACGTVVAARSGDPSEIGLCAEMCKDKACCFPDEIEGGWADCRPDLNKKCPDFAQCREVFAAWDSMHLRVGGGHQDVSSVAQQATGENDHGEVFLEWDPMTVRVGGDDKDGTSVAQQAMGENDPTEEEVEAACQAVEEIHGVADPAGIALCANLCKDKACCFPDEMDGASADCRSDPDKKCSKFQQCREVFVALDSMQVRVGGDKDSTTVTQEATGENHPSEEDIRVACTAVEGYQGVDNPTEILMCVSLCKDKACCFPDQIAGGPDDCRLDPDKNCAMEELCREVFANLPIVQQASPQLAMAPPPTSERDAVLRKIEENCATDSVSTADGWEDCYDSCLFKRCCFIGDPHENCEMDGTEECPLYELCRVVFA